MEIVTGALSTLLPKLGDLLHGEYNLQQSVKGEIMFLEAELEAMQTALLEISEAPIDQPPNRQVKRWAREVRELSYELEDNIDKFMVSVNHAPEQLRGLKGFIDKCVNLLTKSKIRHKIGTHIKDIKTRIREVKERRDAYKTDNTAKPTSPSVDTLRQLALYKEATQLIRTRKTANELVNLLVEENESSNRNLKIVSIVGVGGLGKTTLANLVYGELKEKYDCRAFVTVSTNPLMDKIFKNLLNQLDRVKYKNINGEMWEQNQLIGELRELLGQKRYIIVIDDLWDKSVWRIIECALINNELGSRIITTTRILDVAKQIGSVYELQPLSSVDSRKLFYLTIFGTEERCPPKELAKESRNILRKCGGVPLAIITIGSMLASKSETENTCEYWSKVYKSMGSGLENTSDDLNNMRSILSVSYHDLPPRLRTCLLYLSLYPEDYVIPIQDVIWKWIGEGFIGKESGKDMFEVGEDYVHVLINRSLIQPLYIRDGRKKIKYFRIHDMVLDLITFLSNEEHFLTKLGAQEHEFLPNNIRRLSLHTSNEEDERTLGKKICSHVRSLIVFSEAFDLLPELPSFPVLRVLDLTSVQMDNSRCMVFCKLLHLRYLALPYGTITEIPKEIGKLKFLQVLDIHGTTVVKWPSSFVQLRQLLYLRFNKLVTIPDWFGNLKSLRELIGYTCLESPSTLNVLSGLGELRSVSLSFNEWDEHFEQAFLSWLSSMVRLKYLAINGSVNIDLGSQCDKLSPGPQQLQEIMIYNAVCSVPRWMSPLLSLSVLRISLLTLGEDDLQILGSIPSLSKLSITVKEHAQSRAKELLVIGNAYPFLCLTKLEIYSDIMGVMFAQGAMQKLQNLKFFVRGTMDQFGDLGLGLENLLSLEHVVVELTISPAKPKEVETVEIAMRKAVDMNPNKPKLIIKKRCEVELGVLDSMSKEQKAKIFRTVRALNGVQNISLDPRGRNLTVVVGSRVDPTAIIEKLKEAGIPAAMLPTHGMSAIPSPGITQTATTEATTSN